MKRVAAFALLIALSSSWAAPAPAQQMSVAQYQRKSEKDAKRQQKLQKKAAKRQAKAQKKANKAQKKQLKAGQKADAKANRQLHR
jgi:hypothetical protein